MQLANALVPVVEETAGLQDALDGYARAFEAAWRSMMAANK